MDPEFFGLGDNCQFRATDVTPLGLRGSSCTIHLPCGAHFDCIVPVPGTHMVSNALAGASVGYELGLTPEEIKAGIEGLPSIPGRNNIIQTDKLIILDDCYNANPISMKASLDVLNMAIGRKVAILGDMGELGENEKKLHYEVGEHLAKKNVDVLFCAGELSEEIAKAVRKENPSCEVYYFKTRDELSAQLLPFVKTGDTVLIKASHFMEYPKIVKAMTDCR